MRVHGLGGELGVHNSADRRPEASSGATDVGRLDLRLALETRLTISLGWAMIERVAVREQLALERAVEEGDVAAAGRLLAAGADPNGNCHGLETSVLEVAVNRGDRPMVALFQGHGADINLVGERGRSWLHRAAGSRDRSPQLAMLLGLGADPNARDDAGWTALHLAAAYGYDTNVDVLLNHGADPGISTGAGLRAIDLAGRNQHQAVIDRIGAAP